jgi:hypothetical protein
MGLGFRADPNLHRAGIGPFRVRIEARHRWVAPARVSGQTWLDRQGAYLQLSIATQLNAATGTSRYKLAVLAFEEQVSHLVRPMLSYFQQDTDFEGVDFSSMVQVRDGSSPLAVEFFLPFRTMRCFASYDCTGQQLLDSGTVVINGERAALDLQLAEGKN